MTDLKEDHSHPFNSRLEEFRNHVDLKSKKAFYQLAKIDSSQFFRVIKGFQKPGFGFFEKIANAFPDLNLSWLLIGEGEMILDRVNDAEKTILENYRKLPDEGKIGFEVRTNLYEREYLEHKELMGNIVDVAMNNENKLPFMSWELYNCLQVLQNSRVNKIISIQKKPSKMAVFDTSELKSQLKSQLENNEADIQKLISLDAEYIKEFFTNTNE
jgi:hypothetical protein